MRHGFFLGVLGALVANVPEILGVRARGGVVLAGLGGASLIGNVQL